MPEISCVVFSGSDKDRKLRHLMTRETAFLRISLVVTPLLCISI